MVLININVTHPFILFASTLVTEFVVCIGICIHACHSSAFNVNKEACLSIQQSHGNCHFIIITVITMKSFSKRVVHCELTLFIQPIVQLNGLPQCYPWLSMTVMLVSSLFLPLVCLAQVFVCILIGCCRCQMLASHKTSLHDNSFLQRSVLIVLLA